MMTTKAFTPYVKDTPILVTLKWIAVERMSLILGSLAIGTMLDALNRNDQYATISKFIQNELDVEKEKLPCFNNKAIDMQNSRENRVKQSELLR